MNAVSQANYLLVDGVLRSNALARLYQRGEPIDIMPLYIGTRWKDLHDIGPILVSLRGSPGLLNETCQHAMTQADACLLHSAAPINVVAAHLRHFVAPLDVHGGTGLLRFADPLVARHWLGSYQGAQLDALLGPINAWHAPETPHSWEPAEVFAWRSACRQAPAPEWNDAYAKLGELQLSALVQAGRWQFVEKLHGSVERRLPQHLARLDKKQLTRWFDERLDEAHAWGLACERSLAIWIEYSLRWGDGFTQRPDTPYQQWLALTPTAARLAPALRIEQMDNDCLDIELSKEAS